MPILILNSEQAFSGSTEYRSWPRTEVQQKLRLKNIAKPEFTPGFQIKNEDYIFTIGSCFARNIESQLTQLGLNVAVNDFKIGEELLESVVTLDFLLNRFVCFSILNEFRWALDPKHTFTEKNLIEVKSGKWYDPQLSGSLKPDSLNIILERRVAISKWIASVAKARIIIITLGLAEAWYDNEQKVYLNVPPHRSVRNQNPSRFSFHILSYSDILSCLNEIHKLLRKFGHDDFRMLITVSPVAMGSTFSGGDVILSNMYSKSVQRAVVEEFYRSHNNVDYFPSYESVMLSDRSLAWRDDAAHVSDIAVRSNVMRMIKSYCPDFVEVDTEISIEAMSLSGRAISKEGLGKIDEALKLHKKAYALAKDDTKVCMEYGRFMLNQHEVIAKQKNTLRTKSEIIKDAALFLERSYELGGEALGVCFDLGRALILTEKFDKAYAMLTYALKSQPGRPGILHQLSIALIKLDRKNESFRYHTTK